MPGHLYSIIRYIFVYIYIITIFKSPGVCSSCHKVKRLCLHTGSSGEEVSAEAAGRRDRIGSKGRDSVVFFFSNLSMKEYGEVD